MSVIAAIESKFKKSHVVPAKSGDTVRVHQKIREGNKERIQIFEGLVIRTSKSKSHTASITVRRIASGIGVEKTYLVHSPLITKIEVMKRGRVRRNYLSYMRDRTGKSARLTNVDFDKAATNEVPEEVAPKKETEKENVEVKAESEAKEDKTVEKESASQKDQTESDKETESDKK